MDYQGAKTYILKKLKNGLSKDRTYHSLEHTLDVYGCAIDIAEEESVTGTDLILLKTAALYHDAGFTVQDDDHEQVGCELVRSKLPGFGFSAEHIERICVMIMSTRLPQLPDDKLSKILCDADLDYLGRRDFKMIGDRLYSEFKHHGVVSNVREWDMLQVKFLEEHRYFTERNKKLREPVKQKHLQRVRDRLK